MERRGQEGWSEGSHLDPDPDDEEGWFRTGHTGPPGSRVRCAETPPTRTGGEEGPRGTRPGWSPFPYRPWVRVRSDGERQRVGGERVLLKPESDLSSFDEDSGPTRVWGHGEGVYVPTRAPGSCPGRRHQRILPKVLNRT